MHGSLQLGGRSSVCASILTPFRTRFLKPCADRSAGKFKKVALAEAAEALLKNFALPHQPAVENLPGNLLVMKNAIAAAKVAAEAAGATHIAERLAVMTKIGFDGGVETTADRVLAELADAADTLDTLAPRWRLEGSIILHKSFTTSS